MATFMKRTNRQSTLRVGDFCLTLLIIAKTKETRNIGRTTENLTKPINNLDVLYKHVTSSV